VNRQEKEAQVEFIKEKFKNSKSLIFTGYRGLKVGEISDLRSKLYESQSSLKVVKNRMAKIALKDLGINDVDKFFNNPTAIAYTDVDPVDPAKILVGFAKDHPHLKLRGGFLAGQVLSLMDIEMLSKLPTREVLYSRMLSSMLAPASNTVGVLAAVSRGLVTAIAAIRDKKEKLN